VDFEEMSPEPETRVTHYYVEVSKLIEVLQSKDIVHLPLSLRTLSSIFSNRQPNGMAYGISRGWIPIDAEPLTMQLAAKIFGEELLIEVPLEEIL
jgi:hypothetical protein